MFIQRNSIILNSQLILQNLIIKYFIRKKLHKMNLRLHNLFISLRNTFQSLAKLENYKLRQNKLKDLQGNYRRFQLGYAKIMTANIIQKQKVHSNQFQEESNQVTLKQYLSEGLINYYQDKAYTTYFQAKIFEKEEFYDKNKNSQRQIKKLSKKPRKKFVVNPYIERQQNFFSNQEYKTKISMKDFIQ